ncbi:MAG: amino acid adenylation domain-containing protein, partial [Sphaerospermopsis sp. SIO1G1]|nr:amino acid adenylation domain-containing protein [Sphaerospermopsis sp. SIO1G1]
LDGWSLPLVFKDLFEFYQESIDGVETVNKPSLNYRSYIEWLQQQKQTTAQEFWQDKLSGFESPTPLVVEKSLSSQKQGSEYQEEVVYLSVEQTKAATEFVRKHQLTVNNLVQGVWGILLSRYSQEQDVVFGSTVSGRPPFLPGVESIVGLFINTLPVRVEVDEDGDVLSLLKNLQQQQIESEQFSYSPLVDIQGWSDVTRGSALFDSIFVFENYPVETDDLEDESSLQIDNFRGIEQTNYPLTVVSAPGDELFLKISYDSSRFAEETITRMLGHLQTLLSAIVENPTAAINQLPILTAPEQQQLLIDWNNTATENPHKTVIQLFAEQVEKTPNATAVVFENQQLTYSELNQKANQLAQHLTSQGVGADTLVGIYIERSLEMIIGILGTLKAGGAYLPIDIEYPSERVNYMLADAKINILLTQENLKSLVENQHITTICLNTEWQLIDIHSRENSNVEITSNHLAYVIYTSGSTGKPKGVEITHQGLTNLVNWHQKQFQITAADQATQLAGTGFDAAVWEIWPYLTAGATLHLVKKEILVSPEQLQTWLTENQITVSFVPTPITQELLKLSWENVDTTLRYLLTGGDKLTQHPPETIPFAVVNNYGPTENTVVTTSCILETNQQQTSPSIGKPIHNTKVYILDKNLQPVPIGVPGELYIGGQSLAKGYLNRPQLTAKTFIPNPFEDGTSKLYKTGDLVRYLADGNIEYLGRSDNQVKIRGFRIELGEIETTLSQNADIQASCVIVREDNPGYKRLVAYIVAETELSTSELRQYLKGRIPEYMVPSAFVYLDCLPLTANGKIDRRALPAPTLDTEIEIKYVAPKTETESKLVEIWQQVLGIEKIGINDNFFTLGGDSILSIQIIAKAKQQGIEITIKQLFANPTIAELGAVAGTVQILEIEQGIVSGNFSLTPIQKWFFEQNRPETHHFNQAFLLTVPTDINKEKLEKVWIEIINHHDALRLRFTQTENQWKATHSEPIERFEIEYFDISEQPEQPQIIETTADKLQASLELESHLVKVGLFKLGENQPGRLLIVIHHLVVDGISWRILLEDLETGYQQLTANKKIKLPAKTTSFKSWSKKLTEYAQTEQLKSELSYWLETAKNEIKTIPVDKQGSNTLASIENVVLSLNKEETTALLQAVPKAYKTQINDILLTALTLVLSKLTNSNSVLFNLEGHGREDILEKVDISRTIGWFTTMFPVVVNLENSEFNDLGNAIKSVKEQLRQIPNKGIGYGVLRYLSDVEISHQLQKSPKPEVSFNYLGQFTQTLNTSSLLSSADESSGKDQSLKGQRSSLLDINAIITNEQLEISWTYSSNIHEDTTIEKLAREFVSTLQEIINHCLNPENVGYTPSDFPLVKLNQTELDLVLNQAKLENIEDIYPLSPMQEGMLFESLYAPDGGVYFEQTTFTLNGELNVTAFTEAWQKLVNHHPIFRTSFIWKSLSQPVQVVHKDVIVNVDVQDWRNLSPSEQQTQIEEFLQEKRKQGFQLDETPLIRLYLLQLSSESYQFVWCYHHILLDGWSLPLVYQDLFDFYQAGVDGVEIDNKPSLNYRNYIEWLQEQKQANAQEFWQNQLSGFESPTSLAIEKSLSSQKQESEYQEQVVYLTVEQTQKATEFVRQHQLTLNNLVQGVWGLLLSRYSQENDVVFGSTVSGRPPSLPGVESMVGLFINTLPVRVKINENLDVLSLLQELQQQQIESEQYSYCSLVDIQGWSEVPRSTTLFDSIFVFENYPIGSNLVEDDDSLTITNSRGIEHTNYPLTVIAVPGEQLLLNISYDTSKFASNTIERMTGHLLTLLSAIVEKPKASIKELPILTATEEQKILTEWNKTQTEYPVDKCIHQIFAEQVAKTPDATAVVYGKEEITYTELNKKANQLAHYLHSLGVKANSLVGISVERSVEMIVGLLGILKAGGAYVPLDPEYPQERLTAIIEDAEIETILTTAKVTKNLPENQAKIICYEQELTTIEKQKITNPNTQTKSENLAYVIYTSGSTGKPKGVEVKHKGVNRLVINTN